MSFKGQIVSEVKPMCWLGWWFVVSGKLMYAIAIGDQIVSQASFLEDYLFDLMLLVQTLKLLAESECISFDPTNDDRTLLNSLVKQMADTYFILPVTICGPLTIPWLRPFLVLQLECFKIRCVFPFNVLVVELIVDLFNYVLIVLHW